MIARFHYDHDTFRQFLDDELSSEQEQDVQTHLEDCDDCQSALESVSRGQVDWSEVPQLLRRDPITPEQDNCRAPADFLTKSEEPNSLGRFGRFEIVEYLGTGGMGVVLKGYDPALNRYSAIKVLAPVLATSASARKRFAREAKSAAAVVHEHVVPIQTVDEENGLPYFVMPVIEGKSLQQRVDADGPLGVAETLRIGMQIASGLAAAHAQGLVHRDVKPANVLLENGVERVLLTDFGLARAADDANMTQSGVITGTPQYMSPEQAQGFDVDHQSDLFSLGSVLYFMCTGHSPFRAKTTFGVLKRIISDEHRPVRHANTDVPEWLQNIIDRLLAKDRGDRFTSAAEISETLASWLAHLQQPDVVAKPPTPVSKTQRSGRGRGGVVRAVAGAFGGFLLLLAGLFVSIEMSKGTLTIECADDNVQVRVMKGDQVAEKMLIHRGATSTRISAGSYVVEVDGPTDRLEVKQGEFVLSRGGAAIAKIVEKAKVVEEVDSSFAEQKDGSFLDRVAAKQSKNQPAADPTAYPDTEETEDETDLKIGSPANQDLTIRNETQGLAQLRNVSELPAAITEAELHVAIAETEYLAAKSAAENTLSIEVAATEYKAAKAEYEASLAANKAASGTVTRSQLRRQQTEVDKAKLRTRLADVDLKRATLRAKAKYQALQLAKHQLAAMKKEKEAQTAEPAELETNEIKPAKQAELETTFEFTTADWCAVCKSMEPTIDRLIAAGHPIKKVDVTNVPGGENQLIPSFTRLINGQKCTQWTGSMTKQEIIDFVGTKSSKPVSKKELPAGAQESVSLYFFECEDATCVDCSHVNDVVEAFVDEGFPLTRIKYGEHTNRGVGEAMDVQSTPMLIAVKNGRQVARRVPADEHDVYQFVTAALRGSFDTKDQVARTKAKSTDGSLIDYDGIWPQVMKVRVVTQDGKPVAGAKVFRNHIHLSYGHSIPTTIENAHFTTDSEGFAEVHLSGPPIDLRLFASKDGYVPMHAWWALDSHTDGKAVPREFEFKMAKGTTIGGRVTDDQGQPIEGALIDVRDEVVDMSSPERKVLGKRYRPIRQYLLSSGEDAVTTDKDGRWMLNNVPSDDLLWSELDQTLSGEMPIVLRIRHPDIAPNDWGELQRSQKITLDSLRQSATIFAK